MTNASELRSTISELVASIPDDELEAVSTILRDFIRDKKIAELKTACEQAASGDTVSLDSLLSNLAE